MLHAALASLDALGTELDRTHRLEAVGHLACGVVHDFNNILTIIEASASLLDDGCPACRAALPEVTEIHLAARSGARLAAQLLAFSRDRSIRPQPVAVASVLDGILPLLRRLVPEDIEMRCGFVHDQAVVMIDPGQLEQIVLNLVVNARDAMPAGGILSIQSRPARVDALDAAESGGVRIVAGDYFRLTVSDTGRGMSAEVAAHAFEPFFTTKPAERGGGLGLSTVHDIVERSRGYVKVVSRLGAGTSVDVWLPLQRSPDQ